MGDADKTFKIRIATEAVGSGAEETEAKLAKLKATGVSGDVAAQLVAAGVTLDPATGLFKSVEEAGESAGKKLAPGLALAGANLTRARQEALVLVRELETGGNVTRTLGSLLGSLGPIVTLAAVAGIGLYEKIVQYGEAAKKAAEEQKKLSDELAKSVESYKRIRTPEQWDRENDKIADQIKLLQDKRAISTDADERGQLTEQITLLETQQRDLAILAQRGLERAHAEEQVKLAIRDQINALADADRTEERLRATAAKRAEVENELTRIKLEGTKAAIQTALGRGELRPSEAIEAEANAQRAADTETLNRNQQLADRKIASIKAEQEATKTNREQAEETLKNLQAQQEQRQQVKATASTAAREAADAENKARGARKQALDAEQEARRDPGSVDVKAARDRADEAEREAATKRRIATDSKNYVDAAAKGEEKLTQEVEKQKAIVQERQQAESAARKARETIPDIEAAKKADQEVFNARQKNQKEAEAAALEDQAARQDPNARAILANEAAARRARAQGDQNSADQFQRSADQSRPSASPQAIRDLQEAARLHSEAGTGGAGVQGSAEIVAAIRENTAAVNQLSHLWQ